MKFYQLEITLHAMQRWQERIGPSLPSPVQIGEMVRDGQKVKPSKARGWGRWKEIEGGCSGWKRSIFVMLEDVIFTLRPLGGGCYVLTTILTADELARAN